MQARFSIMRVYGAPKSAGATQRFLVDRVWPRGVRKDALELSGWAKEVAPSTELRKWFQHDPAKWAEFRKRYRAELASRPETWKPLLEAAKKGEVVLLYGARDEEHNQAVVLKEFLDEQARK